MGLTMETQRSYRALLGSLFTFLLVVLVAGCGGGGGEDASSGEDTANSGVAVTIFSVQADPGRIVAVRVGELAILDGSDSSATTTDPLTFAWSFSSKPDTSNAELQNATSVNPSFIADVRGTYMVQLVVSAGGSSSQRAIASVEASTAAEDGANFTGFRVHTRFTSNCADCHEGQFETIAAKTPDHLATSHTCQACHTTFGFAIIRFVDHLEVFGNCSDCHNGVLAIGKSDSHVLTTVECDNCHRTTSSPPRGV